MVDDPDNEVNSDIDQRHNASMANSVAQIKNTRAVGALNSISLKNGVGDVLKKDSFKKQKSNIRGVEEENSVDIS